MREEVEMKNDSQVSDESRLAGRAAEENTNLFRNLITPMYYA